MLFVCDGHFLYSLDFGGDVMFLFQVARIILEYLKGFNSCISLTDLVNWKYAAVITLKNVPRSDSNQGRLV